MFNPAHIHVIPRSRRPNGLRTYITSHSIIPGKMPFRRGVLFSSTAGILLLTGVLLTWMGFSDVVAGKTLIIGPLLIALSLLLLLFSMRQFLIAKKQNNSTRDRIRFQAMTQGAVAAMVINQDDGIGAVTVIMDAVNMDPNAAWRPSHLEYAPPSYNDVIQQNHSPTFSNVQQPSPSEQDSEPPPSYDDAVEALGDPSHTNNTSHHQYVHPVTI